MEKIMITVKSRNCCHIRDLIIMHSSWVSVYSEL